MMIKVKIEGVGLLRAALERSRLDFVKAVNAAVKKAAADIARGRPVHRTRSSSKRRRRRG